VVTVIGVDGTGANNANIQVYSGSSTSVNTSTPYHLKIQATGGNTYIGNSINEVSITNLKATGDTTLTDSLTLGTAPATGAGSETPRLIINSRASNTHGWDVADRKATLGNLGITDFIYNGETNNDTATYSKTILTNTKTHGYSGINLFNKGNIEIAAMKQDWQYYDDISLFSNNCIWYTGV